MEVLLFALFFLVTIVFFVAGKDDFGRKEIKVKSDQIKEIKNDLKDEPKEEVIKEIESGQEEEIKNDLKDEPKEEVIKEIESGQEEEIKNDLKDEPKEEVIKGLE